MNRIEENDILNIINHSKDKVISEDYPISLYDCYSSCETYNHQIAKHLSSAINLDCSDDEKILHNIKNVISYCCCIATSIILTLLYYDKKITEEKYYKLLKWVEDAWILEKCRYTPTRKELEEYLKRSNYSITKQEVKDVIHMLYEDE